jgi:hypothetical protein
MTTKNITLKFKLLFELAFFLLSIFEYYVNLQSVLEYTGHTSHWSLYVENVTSWKLRGFSVGKFSVGTPPVIKYFVSGLQRDRY